jgi:hypothetical protein
MSSNIMAFRRVASSYSAITAMLFPMARSIARISRSYPSFDMIGYWTLAHSPGSEGIGGIGTTEFLAFSNAAACRDIDSAIFASCGAATSCAVASVFPS